MPIVATMVEELMMRPLLSSTPVDVADFVPMPVSTSIPWLRNCVVAYSARSAGKVGKMRGAYSMRHIRTSSGLMFR